MKLCYVLPLFFFFLSTSAFAATISGSLYDLSFELVENAVVELDTNPKQVMVAVDGTYYFEVPLGEYVITARKGELVSEDVISVSDDGNFRFDIIMMPSFESEETVLDSISVLEDDNLLDEFMTEKEKNEYFLYFLLAALAILINILFIFRKKILRRLRTFFKRNRKDSAPSIPKKETGEDDYYSKIISLLKENHGRMSQKEIRKEIPLSEAKISLILAELEHDGKVKKFKRGRSNVISLNV
ncbi:MAG: DUF7343 domain-containing protein [Nanoarchaeota archaeon]